VVLKPGHGPHCQTPFAGDDPTPWRHQGMEIPPIQPLITEYQWHQLVCAACGTVTRAPWPAGGPKGTYGPRVQATVALCTGAYRLSKRMIQQVRAEVCGVPRRGGTVSPLDQAPTGAFAASVEAAQTSVREQAVAHLAETSWRPAGKRAWLWGAGTTWVTVFVGRLSRGGPVARELFGETFAGMLVTDRSRASNWYPVRWRPLCWGRICSGILKPCVPVGAAQRRLVRPCGRRPTRCLPGGPGCVREPEHVRRFAPI
jgi:transposase